jgi:hypothetical protein
MKALHGDIKVDENVKNRHGSDNGDQDGGGNATEN